MSKEDLKRRVCEAIRARRADIKAVAESVFAEPELGFKETKTSDKIKAEFEKLGLSCETGWGITGVRARMKGKKSKKTVALLGELDAIICRDHPHADPKTGAAHCCGHHVQLANMLAVGMAFKDAGIMDELDGDLMLFAVPAEEYVEIDFRNGLREKGDLRYLGGKQQLIAEGAFDGIDIAMQMHANITDDPHGFYDLGGSCNGFVGKLMTYRGRAAHAAGAPDKGINALNAAMMGVMGVNAIRERFREDDFVRFHPIINSGGDLVNVIPDYVTMESYTRAANVDALLRYNTDINRALRAGADAVGATCELQDLPGYLPLRPDENLRNVLRDNAVALFGEEHVAVGAHNAGSTEMGDVSHLIPVVHPWVGCAKGVLHGANFVLDNEEGTIDEDKAMEDILEAGGDDFSFEDGCVEITTDPKEVENVANALRDMGYTVVSAEAEQVPSTYTTLTDEEQIKKMGLLLETLDDNDDVQNVWHNWDMD